MINGDAFRTIVDLSDIILNADMPSDCFVSPIKAVPLVGEKQ